MGFSVDLSIYRTVCLNITLWTTAEGSALEWNVHYLTCPFDTSPSLPMARPLSLWPISMIPTFYGVRLVNHSLGSSNPVNFHDFIHASRVRRQKTLSYSTNVKLGFSSEMTRTMVSLSKACFIPSYTADVTKQQLPYTPATYFYVLHALMSRCELQDSTKKSLLDIEFIPSLYRLVGSLFLLSPRVIALCSFALPIRFHEPRL